MENEEILQDLEIIINMDNEDEAERERHLQRKKRIEEMKRKKHRAQLMQRCVIVVAAVLLLMVGTGIGALIRTDSGQTTEISDTSETSEMPYIPEGSVQLADLGSEGSKDGASNESVDVGSDGSTGGVSEESMEKSAKKSEVNFPGGIQGILQGGDFGDLKDIEDGGGTGTEGKSQKQTKPQSFSPAFEASSTSVTDGFGEEIVSEYGVLIDVADQKILAEKDYKSPISPASMTKILTILTAAEALGITDGTEDILNDTFTMTIEITDYSYVNDCSIAGFSVGEEILIRDLFYGTILPSGADAAVGLATYASGSHEAFVDLMNEKLEALGLADSTHFTNCVGLYNENHYSTVYDMAIILKAAADNPFCKEVLSAHTYNTSPTEQHPEGILLSNWFLRRIEDRDTHGEVVCGKTGFVNQSGSCAASLAVDVNGREYLCVTAGSSSSWQCIRDQHMLYEKYLPAAE